MDELETHKLRCFLCKRKILVQISLIGTSHNSGVHATCADCLKKKGLSKSYKEVYPDDAKEIESWVRAKD